MGRGREESDGERKGLGGEKGSQGRDPEAVGTRSEVKRETGYCDLPSSSLHVLIKSDKTAMTKWKFLSICFLYRACTADGVFHVLDSNSHKALDFEVLQSYVRSLACP